MEVFWLLVLCGILITGAVLKAKKASEKEAEEVRMRKEHPEVYVRLKEMEHERSMKNKETGKALGGLAASLIAKKFIK